MIDWLTDWLQYLWKTGGPTQILLYSLYQLHNNLWLSREGERKTCSKHQHQRKIFIRFSVYIGSSNTFLNWFSKRLILGQWQCLQYKLSLSNIMHESLAKKAFVELLKCTISLLSESHLSLSRYVDINQIAKVTKLIEIWVLVILDN